MHIDGFVIPVPERKREAYLEMARWFDQAMIDHGAIEVIEGWEKDVPDGKRTDFRKAVAAEPGEKIVLSWILWPDKATADAAHEAIHEDERFKAMSEMPFDGRRMIVGSFEPILNLEEDRMTGMPIWYELMTPDPEGVRDFYRAVGGWDIPASGNAMPSGSEYREIKRPDGGNLGGVLTITPAMQDGGAQAGWLPYFHVRGVADACVRLESMGGTTHMPPTKMHVGTLAMAADAQGASFYLMDPIPPADNPDAKSDVWDREKAGHCRWNELTTTDAPAAKAFYTELLGWTSDRSMPMGERGDYLFLECEGNAIGAISPWIGENQPPMWLLYLGVDNIARAVEAARANGGTVINGPHEVPGGDQVFVATDPAGATVAFVGPKGE